MVEEVVYLGFHQDVRVRLATGALVRADVPNDGESPEYEQGDAVTVHLREQTPARARRRRRRRTRRPQPRRCRMIVLRSSASSAAQISRARAPSASPGPRTARGCRSRR